MAALAYQLPARGRVRSAANPTGTVTMELGLMRSMEWHLRTWIWAHTKEARNGDSEPEPVPLPGEEQLRESNARRAERDAALVAAAFDLSFDKEVEDDG